MIRFPSFKPSECVEALAANQAAREKTLESLKLNGVRFIRELNEELKGTPTTDIFFLTKDKN